MGKMELDVEQITKADLLAVMLFADDRFELKNEGL